ncbi:unnamed protein product [Rotaria sp. Silwood2]|nr:unnamed protein product [Rotaria sp. Silwood2]
MSDAYPKVLACLYTEQELIQRVRLWIDLKCQTYFYTLCNNNNYTNPLSSSTALFLVNHILSKYVEFEMCDENKQSMLKLCRAHYSQSQLELKNIKEFELTYTPSDAIMWYTRDSFIYKMINRALRSFDEHKLHAMAFFIRDLRQQLKLNYRNLTWANSPMVYRGICLTEKDMQRIRDIPKGSLISTNGFLSTSRTCDIALAYATKKYDIVKDSLCHILFEIDVSMVMVDSPVIFADVSHVSQFPEENEILFDIGTVFQIDNVNYDDTSDLWTIRLTTPTRQAYESIETLLTSVQQRFEKTSNDRDYIGLIRTLLNYDQTKETMKKQYEHEPWISWFRSATNSTLSQHEDRGKSFFSECATRIVKRFAHRVHVEKNRHYKPIRTHSSNACNITGDDEEICYAREPILFFHFEMTMIKHERDIFSTEFLLQHRRFITVDLTLTEIDGILNEFHSIFYISHTFPSYMHNNPRIRHYSTNLFVKTQDEMDYTKKSIEKLTMKLRHDLAIFYRQEAERALNEQDDRIIAKRLFAKSAQCYERLATETQKKVKQDVDKKKS